MDNLQYFLPKEIIELVSDQFVLLSKNDNPIINSIVESRSNVGIGILFFSKFGLCTTSMYRFYVDIYSDYLILLKNHVIQKIYISFRTLSPMENMNRFSMYDFTNKYEDVSKGISTTEIKNYINDIVIEDELVLPLWYHSCLMNDIECINFFLEKELRHDTIINGLICSIVGKHLSTIILLSDKISEINMDDNNCPIKTSVSPSFLNCEKKMGHLHDCCYVLIDVLDTTISENSLNMNMLNIITYFFRKINIKKNSTYGKEISNDFLQSLLFSFGLGGQLIFDFLDDNLLIDAIKYNDTNLLIKFFLKENPVVDPIIKITSVRNFQSKEKHICFIDDKYNKKQTSQTKKRNLKSQREKMNASVRRKKNATDLCNEFQ
jgi:hypothetical protein